MSDYDHEYDYDAGPDLRDDDGTEQHPWRHPVNIGHLVMGLAFLGLVVIWAVVVGTDIPNEDVRWLLPVPWVLAGGAGLVATAVAARRRASS
ncbi:hypothetical protein [Nocardioides sp. GXQ0305]|jgi:hypothetical protein|uniref:hypothetical protein n=1 Tax=Nocardioides sp. GXQ0305 TaxID=3423912 RepID=UPI003D7C5424